MFHHDKNEAAPMFQLELETRLFRLTAEAPTWSPLLQLPPTIARRARGKRRTHIQTPQKMIYSFLYFYLLRVIWGKAPKPPEPLCGRLFTRKGSANGPVGIGNEIAQIDSRGTHMEPTVAVAAHNRIIHLICIEPSTITSVCCF